MSASSKKKLRNAQESAKMTERQIAEQKEAKKLKLYTTAFVAVLAVILVFAIVVGANQIITNSGMREKNTVAMTVDSHEISNAELNYFYIDTINQYYSQYGSYIGLMGLDTTLPLNEQQYMGDENMTWADYFLSAAKENAKSVYAMNDAAVAAGHTLTEEETTTVTSTVSTASMYATLYGYGDVDTYVKAMYGKGANEESYRNYVEMSVMANSYETAYNNALTYTDSDLRAAEADNANLYTSYTYNQYYVSANQFLEGGTTAEDGTVTYSDEEKATSVSAAEKAAKSLVSEEITSVEALDEAIAALSINEGTTAASTEYKNTLYSNLNSFVSSWVTDDDRKEGDLTCIENSVTDDAGNKVVNGYYVVRYTGSSDNTFALKNVRHILVAFEGGTTTDYGATVYTEDEKAAAKTAAEEILAEFQAGSVSEDSFAALATLKTDDTGSADNGGLYENVYPGQMVTAFEDWCFDSTRAAGDTGIVETEYGYHIMYFVGNSQQNYRDYMITNDLRYRDLVEWKESVLNACTVVDGDTQYVSMDLVLNAG